MAAERCGRPTNKGNPCKRNKPCPHHPEHEPATRQAWLCDHLLDTGRWPTHRDYYLAFGYSEETWRADRQAVLSNPALVPQVVERVLVGAYALAADPPAEETHTLKHGLLGDEETVKTERRAPFSPDTVNAVCRAAITVRRVAASAGARQSTIDREAVDELRLVLLTPDQDLDAADYEATG